MTEGVGDQDPKISGSKVCKITLVKGQFKMWGLSKMTIGVIASMPPASLSDFSKLCTRKISSNQTSLQNKSVLFQIMMFWVTMASVILECPSKWGTKVHLFQLSQLRKRKNLPIMKSQESAQEYLPMIDFYWIKKQVRGSTGKYSKPLIYREIAQSL